MCIIMYSCILYTAISPMNILTFMIINPLACLIRILGCLLVMGVFLVHCCLPSIAQNTENSGEETEQDDGAGGVAVFSRSHHLNSLGMRDSLLPCDTSQPDRREVSEGEAADGTANDAITTKADSESWQGIQCARTATDTHGIQSNSSNVEWDQFKTDFMRHLQTSDDHVRGSAEDYSVKQHLLIKALSELQSPQSTSGLEANQCHNATDSSSSPAGHQASTLSPDQQGTRDPDFNSTAPTIDSNRSSDDATGPVSVLSSSTLSRIEMSALDRALEEVETNWIKDGKSLDQHPLPKLAWEESSSADNTNIPDLMSQLTALSGTFQSQELEMRKQGRQVTGMSKATSVVAETSSQKGSGEEGGKKTVYVDLRPTYCMAGKKQVHQKQ